MAKRKRPHKKTSKKATGSQRTPLAEHHRNGSVLTPPLAAIPKMSPSSWHNDWLPEMLWAALLLEVLGRDKALDVFRSLAEFILTLPGEDKPYDVTHTGLSRLSPNETSEVLRVLFKHNGTPVALRPLLFFDQLPGLDIWKEHINESPQSEDWNTLASAVASTLFHQSQASTDCRWVRVLCIIAGGKFVLQNEEMLKEYVNYPNYGDMRKVRPTIRASELTLRSMLDEGIEDERMWAGNFWAKSLEATPCFVLAATSSEKPPLVGTTIQHLARIREKLVEHAEKKIITSAPDPKYDSVFGISLYAIDVLNDAMRGGVGTLILGRAAIRILVEAFLTLSYLVQKDDDELWAKYRLYGAGQAKLSFLKLDETPGERTYVDLDTLNELANEDMWEEFLPIDFGHWEGSNLRQMSIESGNKDIYDTYYQWPSSYVHVLWGSVRDACFEYCGNPLHRLHRLPVQNPRSLPDAIPDCCVLVDKILELVGICFPGFNSRVTLEK